jgi:uncharacterized protein
MKKKTLILGASTNPDRYAYKAAHALQRNGHPIVNVGLRAGEVANEPIHTDRPLVPEVDTITMYVGPRNQPEWYDYIFLIMPKRIIFNPGAENEELEELARQKGIETENACTLVLLSIGQY